MYGSGMTLGYVIGPPFYGSFGPQRRYVRLTTLRRIMGGPTTLLYTPPLRFSLDLP